MRVLVTDTHELAGLGAVRSLGRAGYIVTAGYPRGCDTPPARFSRWCTSAITYPDPWQEQYQFQEWLRGVFQEDLFDIILPVGEAALFGLAAMRPYIPTSLVAILPSENILFYTLSKYHATQASIAAGLNVPATIFVSKGENDTDWNDDLSELSFPIIIRADNYLGTNGHYIKGRTLIGRNQREVEAILLEYRNIPTSIIAQETIEGVGVGAFQLHWNGELLLDFAHLRIHEVPWTGGASSLRCSTVDSSLSSDSSRLLRGIAYQGVAMVEFLRSSIDGKNYFVEINGRLWGSIALSLHAGIDFPAAIVDCFVNNKVNAPLPSYTEGLKCRNTIPGEIYYLISVLKTTKSDSEINPPKKIKTFVEFFLFSLDLRIKNDYFWIQDPVPWFISSKITVKEFSKRCIDKVKLLAKRKRDGRLLAEEVRKQKKRLSTVDIFDPCPRHILFLCYGNICRSAFAEWYWKNLLKKHRLQFPVCISAGFHRKEGRGIPARFHSIVHSFGVKHQMHRSTLVTKKMVETADIVFVMDRENLCDYKSRFPDALDKVFLLGLFNVSRGEEIADPYDQNPIKSSVIYKELADTLDYCWKTLTEK